MYHRVILDERASPSFRNGTPEMNQPYVEMTYKIPPAGVRRLLFRAVGNIALSVLAAFFAVWYAVRRENDLASLRFSYAITALLVIVVGIPAFFKLRRRLNSFRLAVREDSILLSQHGSPELLVKRNEISRVEEKARSGITIRVRGQESVPRIPVEIAGYSDIRNHLASWGPIVTKFLGGTYLSLVVATTAMVLLLRSQNFRFVLSAGSVLLVCIVLGLMKVQQDSGTDKYTRLVIGGLVLVTALVLTLKVVFILGSPR